ncbi:MAG TPA: hypothetical protein VGD01_08315 [Candidatus Elarobacter sp.]
MIAEAVRALLAEREAAWGGRLRLLPDGALNERSRILALPSLVAELYPPVDESRLARAAFALCAFSDAIVACDDVIDYAAADPDATRRLPEIAVIFAEAYRVFAELFGGERRFWDPLRAYFSEYVDALALEARIARDDDAWSACTAEAALGIVRGKNGLVRLVDAAVAGLAGGDQRAGADAILLEWFAGEQMLDDLNDWREDVRDRNVSVLLRSACEARPDGADLEAIGLRLYRDGHVERVLVVAEELVAGAAAAAGAAGAMRFAQLIEHRRARIAERRERVTSVLASA